MSEIIVDTSVWIEFFRGKELPLLESALKEGRVLLTPIVLAELMSGVRTENEKEKLKNFLFQLEVAPHDRDHWLQVGLLRAKASKKGISLSTPDAHVAQCVIDCQGLLYSFDKIFEKLAKLIPLKLVSSTE